MPAVGLVAFLIPMAKFAPVQFVAVSAALYTVGLCLFVVAKAFSSSGQSPHLSSAIEAAGVRLINALDLVDFDTSGTQVHVCSCCGCSSCESGNWVALRRLDTFVVWVPALARMGGGE